MQGSLKCLSIIHQRETDRSIFGVNFDHPGYNHTLAIREDGTLVATGSNLSGQCEATEWTRFKVVK